jgi:uncharacterized membrane protein
MTETNPSSLLPRWMKALIILSFAMNLMVAGIVGGIALRGIGGSPVPMMTGQVPGFGPWSKALRREDYRALRKAFEARGLDFRAFARADREDRAALVAALRSSPFDLDAFDAAHRRISEHSSERVELGQDLIRAHIQTLSDERRAEIADRMERRQYRPRERD